LRRWTSWACHSARTKAAHVERFAFQPRAKAGRGQQIVQRHDQRKAIFRRVERVHIQDADLRHGRRLNQADERGEIEVLPVPPRAIENIGDEDVLAALDRIGFDAQQAEQPGDGGVDALAQQFAVLERGAIGRGKGFENG
jgi:hypothetical protein